MAQKISPLRPITQIMVPLAELRAAIAELMKQGTTELNLEDLLVLIRTVYRENKPAE